MRKAKQSESPKVESRGIKSIEVGYRVLLAVQRGPGAVQLSDIAKRAALSTGAVHNYLASLVRTGLVEQESRGLYRLGPSAFALSLTSFQQLNGYDILRSEAQTLHEITRASTAISVWSQGGPVSVFIQRSDDLGLIDFRPGLLPMLGSGVGLIFAAYLPMELTSDLIAHELNDEPNWKSPAEFIERNRKSVLSKGYAHYSRKDPSYDALSAPVWTPDNRIAFVLTLITPSSIKVAEESELLAPLLESAKRASLFLAGTPASGPRADWR